MLSRIFCFILLGTSLFATAPPYYGRTVQFDKDSPILRGPWLTGPLLTPSAHTIPKGHFNLEPYLFVNSFIGPHASSMNHSVVFLPLTQFGLTPWMDFTIKPQFIYGWNKKSDSWSFGDLVVGMSFQLLHEDLMTWLPAIRLAINETFPTGKYEHLSINKLETDAGGGGSFGTSFNLIISRLFHCYGPHFLAARLAIQEIVFTSTSVHGPNTYGGDFTTTGRVSPGFTQITSLGLEYTFTQNVALALDIVSTYIAKTTFKGETLSPVGSDKSSYAFSLAPALEYNFTQNIGLIGGIWVSAYTKHTQGFLNGVIALNIYI